MILDQLEYMSLEDGKSYNESLMPLCKGETAPDRSIPVEWIMYDLWEDMRACDKQLADELVEPVFMFMRAQTSKERLQVQELGSYLEYRQGDVGQA
jgi:aristolochene synthase